MKFLITFILAILLFSNTNLVIAATAAQTVTVNLKWTDTSNNEDGFYVYQCVAPSTGTQCVPTAKLSTVILAANSNMYQDTISNDPGSRTICYALTAFNKIGESPKSNTACITTPAIIIIPVAPGNLTGVIGTIITVNP